MPIITSLEPQKHDKERVNVYVDGSFSFGTSLMVVLRHGLRRGQDLSSRELEELRADDALEQAYNSALNFLSFRPRSRREIQDYFRRKKIEPSVIDAVVQKLERAQLLDDREFARFWVDNRQSFRPRGARVLSMEMRQKGLSSEVIDEALADLEDEEHLAYEAGARKLKALAPLHDREFHRKMIAYLQRRGFPYDVSARVAQRLRAEVLSSGEQVDGLPDGDDSAP